MGYCAEPGCINPREGSTRKCATHNRIDRKAEKISASDNNTPINKFSAKGAKVNQKYLNRLKTWKRGKKCQGHFVHECTGEITCHHMHGRSNDTFFDEWAEENEIVLTLDERFWMPLCVNAHRYITDNSEFAWENQYSFKKVTDKIFLKDRLTKHDSDKTEIEKI